MLVTHHVEEIPRGFSHGLILSEGKVVDSGLLPDVLTAENLSKAFGQSIVLDVIRRPLFRASGQEPGGAQEASMTDGPDPLTPETGGDGDAGPRHRRAGIEVFLMRRHSAMEFVAGVMVFPGGGVDDRDRNADIAWFGPEPAWWAERFGVEPDLAEALVCAAARETFEESGVLFAGPAGDPDGIVE